MDQTPLWARYCDRSCFAVASKTDVVTAYETAYRTVNKESGKEIVPSYDKEEYFQKVKEDMNRKSVTEVP